MADKGKVTSSSCSRMQYSVFLSFVPQKEHETKQSLEIWELPGQCSDKESACQCKWHKRCGFDPWAGKIPWRRKRQPTPVLLPGKSHGQRNLGGYSPWSGQESDTTDHAPTPGYLPYQQEISLPILLKGIKFIICSNHTQSHLLITALTWNRDKCSSIETQVNNFCAVSYNEMLHNNNKKEWTTNGGKHGWIP